MTKVIILIFSSLFYFSCTYGDGYLGSTIPMDGLAAWYAADEKVNKDGGNNVYDWYDISGNGYDLSVVNSPTYPLWMDNQINGKPIIQMLANSYFESNSGPGIKDNQLTLFMAMRPTGADYLISSNNLFAIRITGTPPYSAEFYPGTPFGTLNGFLIDIDPSVFTYVYTGDSISVFRNRNFVGGIESINPFNFSTGFKIGSNAGGGVLGNVELLEIIIYSTNLDDDARKAVEDYLIEKYGL